MNCRKVVFVPHCILNQSVRPDKPGGLAKEIVKFFAEADIGIIQLPCPEAEFGSKLSKQSAYRYRECCRRISLNILEEVKKYMNRNYNVLGILGVEFSQTCGVYRIERGSKIVPGKGVLTEELERGMENDRLQIPIISVNLNNIFSSLEKLNLLIKNS